MSRHLPLRPNLEFLRKQAKDLLADLQRQNPESTLAEAQHALAKDYGFPSWPQLKLHVDTVAGTPLLFAGTWDAGSETRDRLALSFDIDGDRVTITDVTRDASGREERRTNTVCADGVARPASHGYAVAANWHGARVLAVDVTKDGPVSRITYEVAADGGTLSVNAVAHAHDGYPAVERHHVFARV